MNTSSDSSESLSEKRSKEISVDYSKYLKRKLSCPAHLELSSIIKDTHAQLRRDYVLAGGDYQTVWSKHLRKTGVLSSYGAAMRRLSTEFWSKNLFLDGRESRFDWCRRICENYFFGGGLQRLRDKEERRRKYKEAHGCDDSRHRVPSNESSDPLFLNWPEDEDLGGSSSHMDSSLFFTKIRATFHNSSPCILGSSASKLVIQPTQSVNSDLKKTEKVENVGDECLFECSDCGGGILNRDGTFNENARIIIQGGKERCGRYRCSICNRICYDFTFREDFSSSSSSKPTSSLSERLTQANWESASRIAEDKPSSSRRLCDDLKNLFLANTDVDLRDSSSPPCKSNDIEQLEHQSCSSITSSECAISNLSDESLVTMSRQIMEKYPPFSFGSIHLPLKSKIRLLDVGSCYNPFRDFDDFLALPIDIAPASLDVLQCDLLTVEIGEESCSPLELAPDTLESYIRSLRSPVTRLPRAAFHVVVFSLLLEYLPAPIQRFNCVERAEQLLLSGGLLLVITPDSKKLHCNMDMIKSWTRAIEALGFKRWCHAKQTHLHCMAFTKLGYDNGLVRLEDRDPKLLFIPQDSSSSSESNDVFFGSGSPPYHYCPGHFSDIGADVDTQSSDM